MSLNIDAQDVQEVLLHDGWHEVAKGSFGFDAYEVVEFGTPQRKAEDEHIALWQPDDCATGFSFLTRDTEVEIVGPMTSILALRIFRS